MLFSLEERRRNACPSVHLCKNISRCSFITQSYFLFLSFLSPAQIPTQTLFPGLSLWTVVPRQLSRSFFFFVFYPQCHSELFISLSFRSWNSADYSPTCRNFQEEALRRNRSSSSALTACTEKFTLFFTTKNHPRLYGVLLHGKWE